MSSVVGGRLGSQAADAAVFALFVASLASLYLLSGDVRHFYENHAVENGQLGFLAAGMIICLRIIKMQTSQIMRAHFNGLLLFLAVIFLREVDVRHTRLEPILGWFFAHRLEYAAMSLIWIGWAVIFRRVLLSTLISVSLRWLRQPAGWAFLAGTLFYIVGSVAEKHLMVRSDDVSEMLEESFELLGTYFFFLSAYLSSRRPGSPMTG